MQPMASRARLSKLLHHLQPRYASGVVQRPTFKPQQRVLVVGGRGAIGQAIVAELSKTFDRKDLDGEIFVASGSTEDLDKKIYRCGGDLTRADFDRLFDRIGNVDHVAFCAGGNADVVWGPLRQNDPDAAQRSFQGKVGKQINLVYSAMDKLNDRGSITLISGITWRHSFLQASFAGAANGAINSFVKSAALEMPRGIRLNVVSPSTLQGSLSDYAALNFTWIDPVSDRAVAKGYIRSMFGGETGAVYEVIGKEHALRANV